jgi:adenine-specific DNA-methyltransferase
VDNHLTDGGGVAPSVLGELEKLDLRSHDLASERRRQLLRMFPEIEVERGKVDLDRLKSALGDAVEVGRERYGMNWPGKADALRAIQSPSLGTLRPGTGEGVRSGSTEHVIIEGDNLEVLKLLQKSYLHKIQLIYIDPPYNTGADFVYPDDYTESLQTYLEYTGQVDAHGKKFTTNVETNGRFHSRWMSMMYPRLYLARNLLRDDGIIFISIDDGELRNLLLVCDEVFGEDNRCGMFVWEKKKKPSFLNAMMGITTEYIVAYAMMRESARPFVSGTVEEGKLYPFNNAGNPLAILTFPADAVAFWLREGIVEPQDMSEGNIRTELMDPVRIKNGRNSEAFRLRGEWRYSQATLDGFVATGAEIVIRKMPFRPNYVNRGDREKKVANLLTVAGTATPTYEDATSEIRVLFGTDVIEYPKPVGLLETLISAATRGDGIVLDFFAGSGTTAHAVINLNRTDGGQRKFILVQLPEPTGRQDYPTIADITRARVQKVISALDGADAGKLDLGDGPRQDRGFRVFRLAESNFKTWHGAGDADAGQLGEQLELHAAHVRQGRTPQDILYEILLKSGFPLTTAVETLSISGKTVFAVAGGEMLVCLEQGLTLELIREIAARPVGRVVCLDEGFAGNDQLKTNAVQIFKTKGIVFKTV